MYQLKKSRIYRKYFLHHVKKWKDSRSRRSRRSKNTIQAIYTNINRNITIKKLLKNDTLYL